jgi:hypothetical protein
MQTILLFMLGLWTLNPLVAIDRTWRDASGRYEIEAELVGFNHEIAVLRKKDGELVAFPVAELSEADRKFLESEEAGTIYHKEELQTWTFRNGQQVQAHLVSHIDRDVVLQRRRNKLYVNDRPFENLPEVYQKILPIVIGQLEDTEFADVVALEKWITRKAGVRPLKYHCEGVLLAFENGDEYAFPYFLFSAQDRKFLEKGRDEFRHPETSEEDQLNHAVYMQAMAREYQRDREQDLQIKRVQTQLLAVAAGVTDLWEVAMIPPGGNFYQARSVIVPANNSLQASQMAAQQWPGLVVGPVRRVTRN